MKSKLVFQLAALCTFLTIATPSFAQEEDGDLDALTCKQVMILSGSDRDATIAFIHGYLVGKHEKTSVNLDQLTDQTEEFLNHCLDNPSAKAIAAMEAIAVK